MNVLFLVMPAHNLTGKYLALSHFNMSRPSSLSPLAIPLSYIFAIRSDIVKQSRSLPPHPPVSYELYELTVIFKELFQLQKWS